MLKRILSIFFLISCLFLSSFSSAFAGEKTYRIGITAIVEHPALDAVRQGAIDALKDEGFIEGKNLEVYFESAQGQQALAIQIGKKFAGMNLDLIIPISTPSTQAITSATKRVPVLFSAVTDPVKAGIVTQLRKPGGRVTGVSDLAPMDKHLELIKDFLPSAKKIGIIYNPSETNSVAILDDLKLYAPDFDFELVEAAAVRSSDVRLAAQSLATQVDAFYVLSDNTVVAALESILAVGARTKTPVFSGDTNSVERGSIAAVGFDYYDVGVQTGQLAARILNGEKPGSINVGTVEKMHLYVNPTAAKKMGLKVSDTFIKNAKKVVE